MGKRDILSRSCNAYHKHAERTRRRQATRGTAEWPKPCEFKPSIERSVARRHVVSCKVSLALRSDANLLSHALDVFRSVHVAAASVNLATGRPAFADARAFNC